MSANFDIDGPKTTPDGSPLPDLKGYRGERMVADLLGMLDPLGFRLILGLHFIDD